AVLGWLSFISMTTTRRHQAIHDLLTRSTVQIRDPQKASPDSYSRERTNLPGTHMPTRIRRLSIIAVYLLVISVVVVAATVALQAYGLVSRACVVVGRCTRNEDILFIILGWTWIGACAVCAGLGWWGRLFGARIRAEQS